MANTYISYSKVICDTTTDRDALPTVEGLEAFCKDNDTSYIYIGGAWETLVPAGLAAWGSLSGDMSSQTDLQTALDAKANSLGADDNYVTDAEKTKLANLSGTNTGDQTLPTDATITTTDVTTNDASTSKHGWFPKLPTASNKFLRDDMTWQNPPGGSEAFPVGSVFISVVSTNPGTLLGYGTWSAFGAGRVLVGIDAGQTEFDTVEETGGAKTHTLTEAEMPSHTHIQDAHSHVENNNSATTGGLAGWAARDTSTNTSVATGYSTANTTATNQNTGGDGAHNNLQPYIVVYMWKRTA